MNEHAVEFADARGAARILAGRVLDDERLGTVAVDELLDLLKRPGVLVLLLNFLHAPVEGTLRSLEEHKSEPSTEGIDRKHEILWVFMRHTSLSY